MDLFIQNFGEAYCATLPTLAEAMGDVLRLFRCERIYGVGVCSPIAFSSSARVCFTVAASGALGLSFK